MRYIALEGRDIYENLAAEEYLFRNAVDDLYLLLWINDPCVVAGKYQNLYAEVCVPELIRNGIPLARRFTGGGTVYHDGGNLNYTFLGDQKKSGGAEYDEWLERMLRALHALGIPAQRSKVCDLAMDGKKISGSAQAVSGGRILHHGTLLFDADLEQLNAVLRPSSSQVISKAVPSVRAEVTNIREYFRKGRLSFGKNDAAEEKCAAFPGEIADATEHPDRMMGNRADDDIETFREALLEAFFPEGVQERILTPEERQEIYRLAEEKYRSPDWIFGRTQKFQVCREVKAAEGEWQIKLEIARRRIQSCRIVFVPEATSECDRGSCSRGSSNLYEGQKSQDAQDMQRNQGIREVKGMQKNPGIQEVKEMQINPDIQEVKGMQKSPDIQEVKEMQKSPGIRELQEKQQQQQIQKYISLAEMVSRELTGVLYDYMVLETLLARYREQISPDWFF